MKKELPVPTNPALLNAIAPMGLEFKPNVAIVSGTRTRCYGIIKYPQSVPYGWLSELCNIPGTVACVTFQPVDAGRFIESLNSSIRRSRGDAMSARDPLAQQRAEKAAEDGERIMSEIDQSGESVGLVSVAIMAIGSHDSEDETAFSKLCKRIESAISRSHCKARLMASLQSDAYRHISPFHTPQSAIGQVTNRIMPLVTLTGGFPFAASGFNDGAGMIIGRDSLGGLVTVDFSKRDTDRTNSNMVILGMSGMGKSATTKNIALSLWARGWKVIFIDPEREYKDLCLKLGGDWINVAGGSQGMLNPLQVRPKPRDDEEEADERDDSLPDLALHMQTLATFFNLYIPGMTDMHRAYLQDSLKELYENFNITWDTDARKLNSNEFPTFSDFYKYLKQKVNSVPAAVRKQAEEIMFLIKPLADGVDGFLWNGHTTISASSDCVCLDTHNLENMDIKIKRTQYFNLLAWCWEEMSRDRDKPVLLIADEAHMMIDPNVPQSLAFLASASKRARKYGSALAVATQNICDFLDPSVKKFGQAVLSNSTYKIMMGMTGQDLKELSALYNLTEAEQEFLASQQRRTALMNIGAKRLKVKFEIAEWKLREYFGKGGGK